MCVLCKCVLCVCGVHVCVCYASVCCVHVCASLYAHMSDSTCEMLVLVCLRISCTQQIYLRGACSSTGLYMHVVLAYMCAYKAH